MRGRSTKVLHCAGYEGAGTPEKARLLAGGHAVLRLFHPSLAADGSRTANYRDHVASNLRGIRSVNVETRSGIGQRNLRET